MYIPSMKMKKIYTVPVVELLRLAHLRSLNASFSGDHQGWEEDEVLTPEDI